MELGPTAAAAAAAASSQGPGGRGRAEHGKSSERLPKDRPPDRRNEPTQSVRPPAQPACECPEQQAYRGSSHVRRCHRHPSPSSSSSPSWSWLWSWSSLWSRARARARAWPSLAGSRAREKRPCRLGSQVARPSRTRPAPTRIVRQLGYAAACQERLAVRGCKTNVTAPRVGRAVAAWLRSRQ